VDNLFNAYISTNDADLGTLIASGDVWNNVSTFNGINLTPGVTNYLHIVAADQGGPQMFIGNFSLSDPKFSFANGTQLLKTNTIDWKAISALSFAWLTPTDTPVYEGTLGDFSTVWQPVLGSSIALQNADFIWANPNTDIAFFSTPIINTPIPAALPLLTSGILMLGALARRRNRKSP